MNIAVAQSGGPTCAINASLVGVFSEALKEPSIDAIFGSINGIEGMIDDHLIDLKTMIRTNEDMEMLLQTPFTRKSFTVLNSGRLEHSSTSAEMTPWTPF